MIWLFQYIRKNTCTWYLTENNPHTNVLINAVTSNGNDIIYIQTERIKIYSGKHFCENDENTPLPDDLKSLRLAVQNNSKFQKLVTAEACKGRYLKALFDYGTYNVIDIAHIADHIIPTAKNNIKLNPKENNKMKNMFGTFGKLDDPRLKMSMFGIAIKSGESFLCYNKDTGELTDVMEMVFDNFNFFFAMPVQHVEVGDLLQVNSEYVFVKKVNSKTITVINPKTNTIEEKIIPKHMFGMKFYTKILAPFDMKSFTEGKSENNMDFMGMNPIILMMMSTKDSEGSNNNMMEMMIMSSMMQNFQKTIISGTKNKK